MLHQLNKNQEIFVGRLNVLCKLFVAPLLHDAKTPKPKIIIGRANIHAAVFFTSIRDIYTLEANFLAEMKATEGKLVRTLLVLENNAPLRRIYGAFMSKFEILFKHLTSLQTASNLAFVEFLDGVADALEKSSESVDFTNALAKKSDWTVHAEKEVKRCVKNEMIARSDKANVIMQHMVHLLYEVWTHLDSFAAALDLVAEKYSHQRLPSEFSRAKEASRSAAAYVKIELKVSRQREKTHSLEERWGMALRKPGRLLIKEGHLTKVSRKSNIRYAFLLFSDVMMYGAQGTSVGGLNATVTHHRTLELVDMNVKFCSKPLAFQILSPKKSFEVICDNLDDKMSWFGEIESAIRKICGNKTGNFADSTPGGGDGAAVNRRASSAAAVWRQDKDAKQCHVCSRKFTTIWRRHHCRRCGEVVCDACSKSRVPMSKFLTISSDSDKLARVCDSCNGIIKAPESWKEDPNETNILVGQFDHLALPPEQKANPNMTKRQRIAHEIFETELSYVSSLTNLCTVFVEPLLADAESRYISIGKICMMNSPDNLTSMSVFLTSVRQLQTIGVELLHAIHDRVKGWTDDRTIGDIFCRYGRLFDLYSVFSDAQEFAASGVVTFAKRSRDFADFVEQGEGRPECRGQNLQSLLIMPIQRVLRYRMLLDELRKDLIKRGHESHRDIVLIDEALNKIKNAATSINNVIKVRENQQELLELESKWNGYECSKAGRTIIKHGNLIKKCRRADKQFYFALFSDVLIYGRRSKEALGTTNRYVHHREIQLEVAKVVSVLDDGDKSAAEQSENAKAFQVYSDKKTFVVVAESVEEKEAWLLAIDEAITYQRRRRGTIGIMVEYAAVWVPDRDKLKCTKCNRDFTMLRRRHHCRSCGCLACDDCTSKRVILKHIDSNIPLRCCDACYSKLEQSGGNDDDDDDDDDYFDEQGSQVSKSNSRVNEHSSEIKMQISMQGSLTDSESDDDSE